MKKILAVMACAVFLGLIVTNAEATSLGYGDDYYVGLVVDAVPSSLTHNLGYINYLRTLEPGAGDTSYNDEIYNRVNSDLTGLPMVTLGEKTDTDGPYTVQTYYGGYILGKYDAHNAGAYVWYVPAGVWEVPQFYNGKYGLSHVVWTAVPEPGPFFLLGAGLVGLWGFRKKFKK